MIIISLRRCVGVSYAFTFIARWLISFKLQMMILPVQMRRELSFLLKRGERIKLLNHGNAHEGKMYHVSKFLNHPTRVEAMLNINALRSYVSIDNNTYRCKIPPIQLLNFEVTPVLELLVNLTSEGCIVELLSFKFEGSEIVESQNKYFSATMKNIITWEESGSESFLDVDVKLSISLQVSAVEGPGNLVIQTLLDKLVPMLVLDKLLQD